MNRIFFYILAALYTFVTFGSIYGLFVDEITIFQLSLTGWPKNLLCIFGLLVVSLVSSYPILLALHRAFSNANADARSIKPNRKKKKK